MKGTERRLVKLEAAAAVRSPDYQQREDIEIEFVDVDGSVSDTLVIPAQKSPRSLMELRKSSF
ncbi:hypothetical protein [Neorhizobium petrolearium]|uniref:Uncharacterized protein n=1 Tax=Neorhizobium petrolearium TaxID=515361 RepID=A0ABY8M1D6_9HYPH|nr:hypothetical protein [Neorhizobium petrolearium]MCC2612638.1 hypothetical protein [Neorhizobium petrolearium]WGI67761.1 hypothetical protein QEO92_22690 [Neorhizobium petrolearium]